MEYNVEYSVESDYLKVQIYGDKVSLDKAILGLDLVVEAAHSANVDKVLVCNHITKVLSDIQRIVYGKEIAKKFKSLKAVAVVYKKLPVQSTMRHVAQKHKTNMEVFDNKKNAIDWLNKH